MKIRATGHRIPVTTIEGALPFYESLGFKCVFQAEEWGWATLEFGDFSLGLYVSGKGGGMGKPGQGLGFLLWVDDIDALHATAQAKNLTPGDISKSADGKRLFDITDPYENMLTFIDS
jgi:predicted enzyme related to lactoylglutathione lyase